MGRRRLAVLLLLTTAVALVPAQSAHAYRLFKHRWYSKTLTYYDATGVYGAQIKEAARILNASGARVKIRSASRRRARVQIRLSNSLRAGRAGEARYRVPRDRRVRKATIVLRPNLGADWPSPVAASASVTAIAAHEIAHVLGLNHEDRRCATMNSVLWSACAKPAAGWQFRCRVLEADDIRGLVRRFGGRAKDVGPEFCDAEPAPAPPGGLAVARDPASGYLSISWTEGGLPVVLAEVLRKAGGCPAGAGDPTATLVARIQTAPGKPNVIQDLPNPAGQYCYAVVGLGALGRPSAPAIAVFDYLGEPVARFTGTWTNGNTVLQLQDLSVDHDGQVVAWSWNFGDGTTSTQRNPSKSWSRAGDYVVTLTVRDNSGLTGTYSTTIQIRGGSNQGAFAH